jgi:signal transduction histidine kinase/ActR/RegA family two-component response regulator/HPt (histidine-containing phosphotransfer) domain-containing protein
VPPTSKPSARFARRLMLLATTAAAVGVLVATVGVVLMDVRGLRQQAIAIVSSLADTASIHSSAALAFADPSAAEETLGAFGAVPSVVRATLYTPDGRVFADYLRPGSERPPDSGAMAAGHAFEGGFLRLARTVREGEERLGTLVITDDMGALESAVWLKLLLLIGLGVTATVIASVVAGRLARAFARPVHALAEVARSVTETQDYAIRTARLSDDELGELTDAFNSMLGRIETQNSQLVAAHDELEERVAARTVELELARERAEAANRAKSAFLANMSHEIRTPMTAILGYSDMLLERQTTAEKRDAYVATIARNGRHLLSIINDILDLSKIEAGKLVLEKIECSPLHLLADTVSVMGARAAEKRLEFEVRVEGPIPEVVVTDPTRVRQILVNLLSNAIKFTERGRVVLRVMARVSRDDDEADLIIEVEDSGIGMTPEQIEGIFAPFTQADQTMTRRYGGTGLGLTISHSLTEALGGTISVHSVPDGGSTFRVELPLGPLGDVAMIEAPNPTLWRQPEGTSPNAVRLYGRVLLAEDGADNRRLIAAMLTQAGAQVDCVDNGADAVKRAQEAQAAGRPYHVVLMDMQMPVLDGYSATRQLRQASYDGAIVALTAHATTADRQRCLDAGCDEYASKPVARAELLAVVAGFSEAAGAGPPVGGAPEIGGSSGTAPPLFSALAGERALESLIDGFANAMPIFVAKLESAMAAGERDRLLRLAHQMKGAGGTYGFDAVTEAAAQVEAALSGPAADGDVAVAVGSLISICRAVRAGLPLASGVG